MLNVNVECQMSACLVKMIWVKDQHAQAQQWLMHAQAWAQTQAQLQRKRRPAASSEAEPEPEPKPEMHDPMLSLSPSLSMHEPLLSLSMLVLDKNHLD